MSATVPGRPPDVAAAVAGLLDRVGIEAVYGAPQPALPDGALVAVDEQVAPVLAQAHAWLRGSPAAVSRPDGSIVVGVGEIDRPRRLRIDSAEALAGLRRELDDLAGGASAGDLGGRAIELVIELDPATPVHIELPTPTAPDRWSAPPDHVVAQLATAERPMLVAGPGVVRAGAVAGLQALAAAADLGVLNTWGAKGVFDWRSRHHWATVGLQADDLTLGGFADADLVLLSGIDHDELTLPQPGRDSPRSAPPTVELDPWMLAPLADVWRRPGGGLAMPALRAGLAEVTQRGWARSAAPLAPTKVTAHYAEALAAGGFVAAAPGRAGYWVARTFATTFLGGARVPARRRPAGLAVACAIIGGRRRPGPRRPLAVGDGPLDAASAQLMETADRLGIPVALELWDPDGARLDGDEHRTRLAAQLGSTRSSVASLATDRRQLDEMIDVAGPVSAWGGLTPGELR